MTTLVPLQPVPAQTCKVILGGQLCQLTISQKDDGVFVDVVADDVTIITAALAQNFSPIVSRKYAGFVGQLIFLDTQGNADPLYTGFGARWVLFYLSGDEYALIQ